MLEQLCDIKQALCTLNTPQRYDIGIIKHIVERIRTGVSNTFDDELSLYEHLECLLKSGGIQFHFLHLFKIFLAELVVRQDIPQQHTPDTELRNRNWLELPKPHNIRHIFAVFIANLITASGSIECHHNALLLSHSVLSYEDTRRRTTT